jgi:polyisoprenoid-binding protein YceI
MKLNRLFTTSIITVSLLSCGKEEKETKQEIITGEKISYTLIPDSCKVMWKGSILGVKFHTGTVAVKEGTIDVAGNQLQGGSFTVDLTKMTATDNNYQPGKGTKEELIAHLSSPDFFSVNEFPTASFVIKGVQGNVAFGDLTVKGKTNEEKITDITIIPFDGGIRATGKMVFDRQKYGVSFKVPGEAVLSDNIELEISIVAKK